MKVAVIDLGTNTFHLMIAEISATSYSHIAQRKNRCENWGERN